MLFQRRDRFPYSTPHLGRRMAWVVSELRRTPSPHCRSIAVDFEDRLYERPDTQGLQQALRLLEGELAQGLFNDHRAEVNYVRTHLGHRRHEHQVAEFLRGYASR